MLDSTRNIENAATKATAPNAIDPLVAAACGVSQPPDRALDQSTEVQRGVFERARFGTLLVRLGIACPERLIPHILKASGCFPPYFVTLFSMGRPRPVKPCDSNLGSGHEAFSDARFVAHLVAKPAHAD
jgi:hypothetical protein